jgi:MFS family permease
MLIISQFDAFDSRRGARRRDRYAGGRSRHLKRERPNALAAGAALPPIWHGPTSAYLSSILFGGSVLAVIAAVTSFVRKAAEPHAWTGAIAAVTIAFGTGQSIGPLLSGALSDGPNGVRAGLWLSVDILAVASVVAAFQPEPAGG